MNGFLYGQTEYNILKNTIHLDDYFSYAKKHNFEYITITDSNLYGHYKFYKRAIKENIKPIIGLEVSFSAEQNYKDTFILYALNNTGYKNLLKISSLAKCKSDFSFRQVSAYTNGIAVVMNFNESYFMRLVKSNDKQNAINYLVDLVDKFENFYVGIAFQNRSLISENHLAVEVCQSIGVKMVAIHQSLYYSVNDFDVYDSLIQIAGEVNNITPRDDYALDFDIDYEFMDYEFLVTEADKLAQMVNLDLFNSRVPLPKFPETKGHSGSEYLKMLCLKGFEKRGLNKLNNSNEYSARLNYELGIIHKMGYDDYFLIVWDFIRYAKQNQILVGMGRGSGPASLCAYCLGITNVNPLKYDLLFERFLNPERVTMPDIDTDFPDDRRDEVIRYVQGLYGKNHVCNISAYGTFQVKSSLRDLGKILKFSPSRLDEIIDVASSIDDFDETLKKFEGHDDIIHLLKLAKKLDNLPKHVGTHAAGIILSESELSDVIPLQPGINGLFQSQLEAHDLEEIGLLKIDFLGIRNLSMITDMLEFIPTLNQRSLAEIPLDDEKTYKLLKAGDTLGVFQLESVGMRRVLTKMQPTCFNDIVDVLALYRPGPMDNIDEYIRRKHGEKFTYIHPDLEPILSPTYGFIVYQEQIMKIAQVFAGYSLGGADILRRAVSKKDEKKLLAERENFVKSSVANGYSDDIANKIYDYIVKFASYGFNKAHSVSYAYLSYQMAYLKANYFDVFISNIMNNVIGSTKSLNEYINYAKLRGVKTICPDINISTMRFVPTKKGLVFPLQAIFGIGSIAANEIIIERTKGPYTSLSNLKSRVKSVNSKILEGLIFSSALDSFGKSKKALLNDSGDQTMIFDSHLDDIIEINDEYDEEYLAVMEKKYIGLNLKYSPYRKIKNYLIQYKAISLSKALLNQYFKTVVLFNNIKVFKTKAGPMMLKATISDDYVSCNAIMFATSYSKVTFDIEDSTLYLIDGKIIIDENTKEKQFIISNIQKI